jgi:adenosylhomocysteinase
VNPVKALEAIMDGFRVLPMTDAAAIGDFFVTVTGDINVIDRSHLEVMKDGAIMANSGHFDAEINLKALAALSEGRRRIREHVEEFRLHDGRKLFLLGEGRLVNLAAAEGHPAAVMDMSFANQALGAEWIATNHHKLEKQVYALPPEVDEQIARLKLHAMGVAIDYLTGEQQRYLTSWQEGT